MNTNISAEIPTKVVALDIYGTILPSEIPENPEDWRLRRGTLRLLDICKTRGLILCTHSDSTFRKLYEDLIEAKVAEYFDQIGLTNSKDPEELLNYYRIAPEELFVIGDNRVVDILPAHRLGCRTKLVPKYQNVRTGNTSISRIIIP